MIRIYNCKTGTDDCRSTVVGGTLTHARTEFDSPCGKIVSA